MNGKTALPLRNQVQRFKESKDLWRGCVGHNTVDTIQFDKVGDIKLQFLEFERHGVGHGVDRGAVHVSLQPELVRMTRTFDIVVDVEGIW